MKIYVYFIKIRIYIYAGVFDISISFYKYMPMLYIKNVLM